MSEINLYRFGRFLLSERHIIDMNIREFAEKLEVSPSTLSRIENGKTPNLNSFFKICRRLGANPMDFVINKRTTNDKVSLKTKV